MTLKNKSGYILLADDDSDDCLFFKEALDELEYPARLKTVHDGVELMHLLGKSGEELPHVLFLDLNMPRKNGQECLAEIKKDARLLNVPVIIYSTSYDVNIADQLYRQGANMFASKPADFDDLKVIIHRALGLVYENRFPVSRDNFYLNGLKSNN